MRHRMGIVTLLTACAVCRKPLPFPGRRTSSPYVCQTSKSSTREFVPSVP